MSKLLAMKEHVTADSKRIYRDIGEILYGLDPNDPKIGDKARSKFVSDYGVRLKLTSNGIKFTKIKKVDGKVEDTGEPFTDVSGLPFKQDGVDDVEGGRTVPHWTVVKPRGVIGSITDAIGSAVSLLTGVGTKKATSPVRARRHSPKVAVTKPTRGPKRRSKKLVLDEANDDDDDDDDDRPPPIPRTGANMKHTTSKPTWLENRDIGRVYTINDLRNWDPTDIVTVISDEVGGYVVALKCIIENARNYLLTNPSKHKDIDPLLTKLTDIIESIPDNVGANEVSDADDDDDDDEEANEVIGDIQFQRRHSPRAAARRTSPFARRRTSPKYTQKKPANIVTSAAADDFQPPSPIKSARTKEFERIKEERARVKEQLSKKAKDINAMVKEINQLKIEKGDKDKIKTLKTKKDALAKEADNMKEQIKELDEKMAHHDYGKRGFGSDNHQSIIPLQRRRRTSKRTKGRRMSRRTSFKSSRRVKGHSKRLSRRGGKKKNVRRRSFGAASAVNTVVPTAKGSRGDIYGLQDAPTYPGVYPMSANFIGEQPNLFNVKRNFRAFGNVVPPPLTNI